MVKYIGFIRHGDYEQLTGVPSALQPFPLTESGLKQARACGSLVQSFCAQEGIQLSPDIYCSVLLRAWQTANALTEQLNDENGEMQIVEDPSLCERSVGSLANLTVEQIESIIESDERYSSPPSGWKSDSHYCLPYPGAESLMDSGKRVACFVEQVIAQADRNTLTLFVGHGASIRHACHYLGILPFEKIATVSMYHARPIFFKLSNKRWEHVAGEWKLRGLSLDSQKNIEAID